MMTDSKRTGRSALFAITFLTALWSASSGALTVSSDLFAGNRFPEYRTFAWVEGRPARHPAVETAIREQTERWLVAGGLEKVKDQGAADLVVSTHAERDEYFGIGLLKVAILDTESKRIAWAGQASDIVTRDVKKLEKKVRKALKQMFADFPRSSRNE